MKVAISLPDPVFDAAERLARQHRVSRSRLYTEALTAYLETRDAAGITARLDAVYASESAQTDKILSEMQTRSLDHAAW